MRSFRNRVYRTAMVLAIGTVLVVLCSAAQADRIMVGLASGKVYGRDEYNLGTHIASSYADFGSAAPVSALTGAGGKVAIGLNTTGYNALVRGIDAMSTNITQLATGSPISAMGLRGSDTVLIGERGVGSGWSGTFVRNINDLNQVGTGYTGGSVPAPGDGWNWGTGISGMAAFANGDFLVGCDNGIVTTRRSTDIFDYVTDLAVAGHGYANFGTPVTAVATLLGDKFAVALSSGYIDIRPRNDTWVRIGPYVNFGAGVTSLVALPDNKIAIGLANGQVHVRSTSDLTAASSTSATFTGGAAITAMALTANGNIAIGTADNLVFVRRSTDLTSRPAGFVGTDGINFGAPVTALAAVPSGGTAPPSSNWRDVSNRHILQNDALEARLQSGVLYQLTDRVTGRTLLSIDPSQLPGTQLVFGSSSFSLDGSTVAVTATSTTVSSTFTGSGITWQLNWSIEPGAGDLILQTSADTPQAIEEFRAIFFGCNISDHSLVWVDGYGVGQVEQATWYGVKLGDPQTSGSPMAFAHPIAALFQGDTSGWWIEGREDRVGPGCLMVVGKGQTANMGMVRRFPLGTSSPQMYQIRIRSYNNRWEDAADPYISWLETGAGFVPLAQRSPSWVRDIKNQAYITMGDLDALDALAARVDPSRTYVGRQAEFRNYPFDIGYPNYQVNNSVKPWITHARQLGFHVGAHFNAFGIDKVIYPNLVTQFQPGLMQVGTDGSGNPIYDGAGQFVYCSPAYKPWRDYLIVQMADAVNAGIDVIYLDQTMGPGGKFVVNGVDGFQGLMYLMREIQQAYPNVAVQTEQFNPLTAKYASFALSQMPLGHPLGGYILHNFTNIVPEGVMYSPTEIQLMDAYDCWGYMVPGADTKREESWMQIAEAMQDYDLVPDSRLTSMPYRKYVPHYTSGATPVADVPIPPEGLKLFGFTGADGVTAYLEKHTNRRGLVIYEPGEDAVWLGTRHYNITSWPGPGMPVFYDYGKQMRDWLIYNGNTILGLNPQQSYYFDETLTPRQDRFHITSIPADFAMPIAQGSRQVSQEIGYLDSYFKVTVSGTGTVGMYVPDDYDVYLGGVKAPVNRVSKTAQVTISSTTSNPSCIRAFKRTPMELVGKWIYFPWETPTSVAGWVTRYNDGFRSQIGGIALVTGKLPQANNIRLRGSYAMSENSAIGSPAGQGVFRINGTEVLRIDPGPRPYQVIPFDVDISSFAGQDIIMEFACDGWISLYGYADWFAPEIIADSTIAGLVPIGGASAGNNWSSASAVTVRASSQHYSYVAQNLINGSGISTEGNMHGNSGLFISGQMDLSKANPRGGTVPGGHWVEFAFDKMYPLGQMWLWNFNAKSGSADWRIQGFRNATVQYSATGSTNPAEWKTIFTGDIPMAHSTTLDYLCIPSMKLNFNGANARYVVITTADSPGQNWSSGTLGDAGLGEVRFYALPGQTSIGGAKQAAVADAVTLTGAVVTAAFRDGTGPVSFAVEESDRAMGIRVISNASVQAGDSVALSGQVDTVDGERVIQASEVTVNSIGNPAPLPLGMSNISSGGGAYFGQDAVVDNADANPDVMSAGTNSIGLLATVFGRVTARNDTGDWSGYFYIDDGSGMRDGSGNIGIRCGSAGSGSTPDALPAVDSYVAITGVMGVQKINNVNARYFRTVSVRSFQ